MSFNWSQAVGAFAGMVTLGGAFLCMGAAAPTHDLGVIDVRRINIREPDGKLRLAIFDAANAPGIVIRGREIPHPDRRVAGMLFYNDEGSENGGLVIGGERDANGVRHSHESLTLDRYEQDQVVQLQASEDGADRLAGLSVVDRPEQSLDWAAIERGEHLQGPARDAAFANAHAGGAQRAFLGRTESGESEVVLRDSAGKKRLVLSVAADGVARIAFLDAAGKVTRTIDPGG